MTFYLLFLLLISVSLVLSHLYAKYNAGIQISLLVLVIAVSGFREYVGEDFRSYVNWYELKSREFEFGFELIMDIFRWMHASYHFLFFFVSFCTISLVFLGVKKYTVHSNLAFFFFLLIPFLYLHSWSLIRQALAMAIFFYAFHYLITKKYLIYTILMCIAMSIHITSVIPFILVIAVYVFADKVKTIHLVIFLCLSLILSQIHWVSMLSSWFLKTRYSYYFSTDLQSSTLIKMVAVNGLAIFMLFFHKKMKANYPNQKYFMLLFFTSVIITNIFSSINDLTRFAYYFYIFEIVVFADLVFLEFKKRRFLIFTGLYLYGIASFFYSLKVDQKLNNQKTKYIPYNCIFYKFDDAFFMMGTDYLVEDPLDVE
jgi:hypothetical protein